MIPFFTISDIILAPPLPLPPELEQWNRTRSRIDFLLSSTSLVSTVLLAKSNKILMSTDDLDISLLGSKLSKHIRLCKIFISAAHCKE